MEPEMTIARDSLTDLLAIAAMPGLEQMSETIVADTDTTADAVMLHLVFCASQWTTGSRNELTSLLRHDFVWDQIRASANRVGRHLPRRAPTHDTFRHFRDRAGDAVGAVAAHAFTPAMATLVRDAGLLTERAPRWHAPHRTNTVFGDGTVFQPASDIQIDPTTGLATGSRSTTGNPRIVERFHGKREQDAAGRAGMPICLLGVRGDGRWQRAVLGLDMYFDRDEIGAGMRIFHAAKAVYGSTIHGFAYDRLMSGVHLQQVMRAGVVPIVDMPNAAPDDPGIAVPDILQEMLGTSSHPKHRAKCEYVRSVELPVGERTCRHHLFALDGAIVSCNDDDLEPSWSSPPLTQIDLRFRHNSVDGHQLIGVYRVPCPHAHPLVEIDHSGDRLNAKRERRSLADWIRPIDLDTRFTLRGYRQDVESTFSTGKRLLALDGRACSYDTDPFLFDVVGFGLWNNATLWDVYTAQHTEVGKACARIVSREAARNRRSFK
jgi:hypothetical protein